MDNMIDYLIAKYNNTIINIIMDMQNLFPNFKGPVQYDFFINEDCSITGYYSKEVDCLRLNLFFIDFGFERIKQPYEIIKFIIHELRHRYQHIAIKDYYNGLCDYESEETILSWEKSFKEYSGLRPRDKESEINYYNQSIELDAFAFSHAAIIELYGDEVETNIPEYYLNNPIYNNLVNKHREKLRSIISTLLTQR